MLSWWKRLLYSFASVLGGAGLVGVFATCRDTLVTWNGHFDLGRSIVSVGIILAFSLPGWMIAIPIVVLVKNFGGWRLWVWGAAGFCIGPAFIFAVGIYGSLTNPRSSVSWSDGW